MKGTEKYLLALILTASLNSISAQTSGKAEKKAETPISVPMNPAEERYKLLDKTFRDFVTVLHSENRMNAKSFLSESVKDMVGPEALEALSKSIRRDNEILTLSEKIGYDSNANNMEYLVFGYKVDTEPRETIQIKFDNLAKIMSIQSSRPNKK